MAMMTANDISKLFESQINKTNRAAATGANKRAKEIADAVDLKDFGRCADRFFRNINGDHKSYFASWIPGVPIPALLAGKRRLTVDVTPNTLLDFGASYNISPDAFLAFAESGILAVNIRDFDPSSSDASKRLEAYATADQHGFLPKLFERAPRHIYFLSTIRSELFNPLFASGGSLVKSFEEAGSLAAAAREADDLQPFSELIRRALFRNERPTLTAVRWHWAYAQATKRFSSNIDPGILKNIESRYERIKSEKSDNPAADYLELANYLRFAHLLTSAPISASFGGVYNLLLDGETEFLQAVRYGSRLAQYDLVQDRILDTIRSLQLGKLPIDVKREIPLRYRSTLATTGVEVYVRYNDTSYLHHYEDATHQKQLVDYVLADDGLESSFVQLEAEIDALLLDEQPTAGAVARLAAEHNSLALARGQRLKKLTHLHQGVELPGPNLVTHPSTPIYATDPKLVNLLVRAARLRDNNPSIGSADDVRRRTIWFYRIFRRPPH